MGVPDMRKLFLSTLLVVTTASPSLALESFTATFELRRPNANGAVIQGSIAYDRAGQRYRIDYTGRQYSEVFKFDPDDAATPVKYSFGANCGAAQCQAAPA